MDNSKTLIETAKSKYPLSISYTGRLTDEEIEIIRQNDCEVKCVSAYMNGTATYNIRANYLHD